MWDQKDTPPLRDLTDTGIEMEMEKYVDCPERANRGKHKLIRVELDAISIKKMVCCALEMQGFDDNSKTYIIVDGKYMVKKADVYVSGIVTKELVEDVLANPEEYFP
jgi:hypothetical protein